MAHPPRHRSAWIVRSRLAPPDLTIRREQLKLPPLRLTLRQEQLRRPPLRLAIHPSNRAYHCSAWIWRSRPAPPDLTIRREQLKLPPEQPSLSLLRLDRQIQARAAGSDDPPGAAQTATRATEPITARPGSPDPGPRRRI
ncbi:MAG: hypothetical protein M5U01_24600 [Ardenticatenaceae bacterium]|nr:hypothetical protein [Ardenticatenaceae bacterium]